MKAKNKCLEKAKSAIIDGLYEEAAEHALAGIKQTKNNKKTSHLNTIFTRILSSAATVLNGDEKPASLQTSIICLPCDSNTSICLSFVTICSGVKCFFGMTTSFTS